jgi:hypothetical protein
MTNRPKNTHRPHFVVFLPTRQATPPGGGEKVSVSKPPSGPDESPTLCRFVVARERIVSLFIFYFIFFNFKFHFSLAVLCIILDNLSFGEYGTFPS